MGENVREGVNTSARINKGHSVRRSAYIDKAACQECHTRVQSLVSLVSRSGGTMEDKESMECIPPLDS